MQHLMKPYHEAPLSNDHENIYTIDSEKQNFFGFVKMEYLVIYQPYCTILKSIEPTNSAASLIPQQ